MSGTSADPSAFELSIRERFASRYDADYEAVHGPAFLQVESAVVLRLLDLREEDSVLDLGCGTGRLSVQLAPRCAHLFAVDRSPSSLEILRSRLARAGRRNVTVLEASLTAPFQVPRKVSKVLCVQVLQHIPDPDARKSVFRLAADSLVPGGLAVFVNEVHGVARRLRNKPREVRESDSLFFHPYGPGEMQADMQSAGFSDVRETACGVLYWTRYRAVSRSLAVVDTWLSRIPATRVLAKFIAAVGTKGGATRLDQARGTGSP